MCLDSHAKSSLVLIQMGGSEPVRWFSNDATSSVELQFCFSDRNVQGMWRLYALVGCNDLCSFSLLVWWALRTAVAVKFEN